MTYFGQRLISIAFVSIFILLASAKETRAQEYVPFDPNFGVNGVVTLPAVPGRNIYCCNHHVHVLDDGRILVALSLGDYEVDGNNVAIFRFNGRGELDRTFGQDGYIAFDWDDYTTQKRITSISTDRIGRIIITAQTYIYPGSTRSYWGIAVVSALGLLDDTFNGWGIQTIDYPGNDGYIASAAPDVNNDVIVVGNIGGPCPCSVRLSRFLATGGTEPETIRDFPGYTSPSFVQDSLGRYIVVAVSDSNPSQRAIWRLHPSGELDTSFGNNGVVIDTFDGVMPIGSVHLQSDNKIIIFNHYIDAGQLRITRFTEDGTLDSASGFGDWDGAGHASIYIDNASEWAMQNAFVDSQDRVVVVDKPYWAQNKIEVFRHDKTGHPDPDFGSGSYYDPGISFIIGNTSAIPWSIDEMPDGDLLILAGIDNTPTLIRLDLGDPTALIQNSGFEFIDATQTSKANSWVGINLTKDRRICNKTSPSLIYAHSGKCAFLFKGSASENSQITQVLKPTAELSQPGTAFTLSAWKNGSSILGKVVVHYTDGTKQAFSMRMGPSNGYQQFESAPFFLAKTAKKFKVSFKYTQTDKSYVDDVALVPNSLRRDALLSVPPLPAPAKP